MALPTEPPLLSHFTARRRFIMLKVIGIGVLALLLQIPVLMTYGVLRDRQRYQTQATEEISRVWGQEQRLTGPVLAVPYTYVSGSTPKTKKVNNQWVETDEPIKASAVAYFLPDALQIDAAVDPEVRHRGIYDVVVYTSQVRLSGSFRPDFAATGTQAEQVDWARARLLVGVSDLHGLRSISALRRADGTEAAFDATEAPLSGQFALAANPGLTGAGAAIDFAIDAVIQGSGALTVVPVGRNSSVKMRSSWSAPSFSGAWLPVERRLSEGGFTAEWKVAPFSRGFPQSWTSRFTADAEVMAKLHAAEFGVRLGRGVDGYSMVARAQKYGVLFCTLVFAVFFLFEVTADLRIHPLQYAMVGAALALFFLGFLALTEFCPTGVAYGAAAGACTGMVGLYAWTFLRSGARTLIVCGGLGATYAYLYFVLKSEDYALIAGTAALFAMLGLAMFATRRINWYAVDGPRPAPAA
jgi:inner membrane protein